MINLMYAGNYKVFDGLIIAALSAVKHVDEPMSVYLLTMDLSGRHPDYLPLEERHREFLEKIYKSKNPESRVILLDVGALYRAELLDSPNAQTDYTPYCFLRLFADRIPEIPDRILYLDTDTVICNDISELYNTDLRGCELGAALDYYGKIFMGYHYFNTGVLLLDMAAIRKSGLFRRTVGRCNEKKIFLPDQTALNRLTKKKVILNGKYNEQKHYRDDTVIQHFSKTILWLPYFHTRNIKPWQTEKVKTILTHKFDDLLDEYLETLAAFRAADLTT